jgi:hypothetical protein
MATSHLEMFRSPMVDEGELVKLVDNHLLPSRVILQWRSTKDEDIRTPNTNEIVVFTSFFKCGFHLPSCEFLCGLLQYYKNQTSSSESKFDPSNCRLCPFVRDISRRPPEFLSLNTICF